MTNPLPSLAICSICRKPIQLETSKTDENGDPVHEDCYVATITGNRRPTKSTHH